MKASPNLIPCQQCKGTGRVERVIKPIHGRSEPDDNHWHTVICDVRGCNNGYVDIEAYYKEFKFK
jgi:hypothetical protein